MAWQKRIKYHMKLLAETRKYNRQVEAEYLRKIKLEKMQLTALKK